MTLLTSIEDMVLGQDTSNWLIVDINVCDCLKASTELGEDRRRQESCFKYVKDCFSKCAYVKATSLVGLINGYALAL